MNTLEYRTRFKTSKRKLPKFYSTIFNAGDEILVDECFSWLGGQPRLYQSTLAVIECIDDYAIVCKYKNSNNTILIIDWKSLKKGTFNLDKEINKRFDKLKKTAIEKFNAIEL